MGLRTEELDSLLALFFDVEDEVEEFGASSPLGLPFSVVCFGYHGKYQLCRRRKQ